MNFFVRDRGFYRSLFSLTAVLALSNVIVFSVNLADSVMIGRYSEAALSGVSLANQIQFLLQMIVTGVGEGALVFGARFWGGKDIPAIGRITNISVKSAFVVSAVMGIAVGAFPSQILGLLSNETAVVAEGVKYIRVMCFTYPVFALTMSLLAALRGVETARIGMYVSLSTLFVNIGLNYVLIYGKLGFPELGSKGAAIATLVARCVELLIVVIYIRFADKKIKLRLHDFGRMDMELFRAYIRRGLPVIGSGAAWGVAMAVQTAILGHMGAVAITANSIATTVFQIVSVVVYSSAGASAVVLGKAIGEGKSGMIRQYSHSFQAIYLVTGVLTGLFMLVIRAPVVRFYDVSPESSALAMKFMSVLAVTVVGTAYQMPCLTGMVRTGGDTSFVLKNDMIFMWGIVLPLSFIFAFVLKLSPLWVFIALKSDQVTKCAVAAVKVNRYKWLKSLR